MGHSYTFSVYPFCDLLDEVTRESNGSNPSPGLRFVFCGVDEAERGLGLGLGFWVGVGRGVGLRLGLMGAEEEEDDDEDPKTLP